MGLSNQLRTVGVPYFVTTWVVVRVLPLRVQPYGSVHVDMTVGTLAGEREGNER